MVKTRVISSVGCPKCKFYLTVLRKQGFEFDVYDADDQKNQKELDEWRISSMPVVQIIDIKEDGTIKKLWQFPSGQISPRSIRTKIKMLEKKIGETV